MKIESGITGNISFGEGGGFGQGTEITKQGGAVTLLVGQSDLVNISQVQDSLLLNINDSQRIMLSPEESGSLEIKGDKSHVTIDPNVNIPIRGISSTPSQIDVGRTGPAFAASRQNETSFTASITQRLLISDLKSSMDSALQTPGATTSELEPIAKNTGTDVAFEKLSTLSSEEKRELVYELSDSILSGSNNLERDRRGINQILQSARAPEEFKTILSDGIAVQVHQSMVQGVSNSQKDSILADFNITAGLFGSSELATDPAQAKIASDALQLGFTRHQILSTRQELGQNRISAGDFPAEAVLRFSENPILMTATTLEEKSAMLGTLMNENAIQPDHAIAKDRSIVSILEFANSKAEFDFLVDTHGGKEMVSGMLDAAAIAQFNKLAGGYERLNLATIRDHAIETFGGLSYLPETGEKVEPLAASAADLPQFISAIFAGIERQIGSLDRRSIVVSAMENVIRESQGLPILDPIGLRKQGIAILQEMPSAGWELVLDNLRRQNSLTDYAMSEIVAQPLAHIFKAAASELSQFIHLSVPVLEERLKNAIKISGTNSKAAEVARSELMDFQSKIPSSQIRNLQEASDILVSIFPPPPASIQTVFAKIFPGPDISIQALKSRDPGEMLSILNQLSTIPAPVLARVANLTRQTFVLPTVFPEMGKAFESLGGMEADLPVALRIHVEKGISFVRNISNGSHAQALDSIVHSLRGYGDPELRKVADFAVKGSAFFSSLASGEFRNVLSNFTTHLTHFVVHPAVPMINDMQSGIVETESSIQKALKSLQEATDEFVGSEPFQRLMETVRMSGDFVGALYRGNFVRMLAPLNSRLGNSPAVLHLIQSGLHLTNVAGTFLRTVVNRDFERPIAQAVRKNPTSKGLKDAEEIFSQAAQSFTPIANVEYMDALWQYHKQLDYLKDEVLIQNTIEQLAARR